MVADALPPNNAGKTFNFPSMTRDAIAPAVVEEIVPALADAIHEAAAGIAQRDCGDSATIFDVERIAGDLLYALADLLLLSPVPLRGVRDLLRFHQLDEVHAAAYFGIDVALPLLVTRDDADEDDEQPATLYMNAGDYAPKSSNTVQFNDVASAARVLGLSPAQIAELEGGPLCACGCGKPARDGSKYHNNAKCRKAAYMQRQKAQAGS